MISGLRDYSQTPCESQVSQKTRLYTWLGNLSSYTALFISIAVGKREAKPFWEKNRGPRERERERKNIIMLFAHDAWKTNLKRGGNNEMKKFRMMTMSMKKSVT